MFPHIAHAATSNSVLYAQGLLAQINGVILFPLISLMMAAAFAYFLYGAFEYARSADNEVARTTGRTHLLYGVIGLFIMVSAYSILGIAAGTFGLQDVLQSNTPSDPTSQIPSATGVTSGATAPGGSTQQPGYTLPNVTGAPVDTSGANTGSGAPSGTADNASFQYVYDELMSNGYTSIEANNTVNYMASLTSPDILNTYLTSLVTLGALSAATQQQVMQQQFPDQTTSSSGSGSGSGGTTNTAATPSGQLPDANMVANDYVTNSNGVYTQVLSVYDARTMDAQQANTYINGQATTECQSLKGSLILVSSTNGQVWACLK